MLPTPPTRDLHNPHAATRHKHGRIVSQHREAEKSVAPTDCSTSLWRKTHRIRPNRLRDNGVWCVRCMQGVYDTLNLSYTLETSVYQPVTYKKCKMAAKAHALFYKRADGEGANICVQVVHFFWWVQCLGVTFAALLYQPKLYWWWGQEIVALYEICR